jgi:hypothetical protein
MIILSKQLAEIISMPDCYWIKILPLVDLIKKILEKEVLECIVKIKGLLMKVKFHTRIIAWWHLIVKTNCKHHKSLEEWWHHMTQTQVTSDIHPWVLQIQIKKWLIAISGMYLKAKLLLKWETFCFTKYERPYKALCKKMGNRLE